MARGEPSTAQRVELQARVDAFSFAIAASTVLGVLAKTVLTARESLVPLLGYLAALLAPLAWWRAHTASYRRWRAPVVAALRVVSFVVTPLSTLDVLRHADSLGTGAWLWAHLIALLAFR